MSVYWQILLLFGSLSMLAVGGGSAIIPELQRQTVGELGWLSPNQFVDIYALTQVTPGPSMMIVCLVGLKAGGWPGALLAGLAMFGPTTGLVLLVRGGWERIRQSRFKLYVERVTRPVAVGTMLASATVVAKSVDPGTGAWIITAAAAGLIGFTRVGIIPTMLLAAVAGLLGATRL